MRRPLATVKLQSLLFDEVFSLNPCWFSLLHLSQNFSYGIVHLLISSTFPTDEHGMSSCVRFKSICCKALSSMFVDLRFARPLALRPHFNATSSLTVNRCISTVFKKAIRFLSGKIFWSLTPGKIFAFCFFPFSTRLTQDVRNISNEGIFSLAKPTLIEYTHTSDFVCLTHFIIFDLALHNAWYY